MVFAGRTDHFVGFVLRWLKFTFLIRYQFQVLLRLEMLSTLVNKDQTLGEEETNDEVSIFEG